MLISLYQIRGFPLVKFKIVFQSGFFDVVLMLDIGYFFELLSEGVGLILLLILHRDGLLFTEVFTDLRLLNLCKL